MQTFATSDPGWAFADPARRSKLAAAFPAIDEAVEAERIDQGVQGLAIGIVIDGELAHAQGRIGAADGSGGMYSTERGGGLLLDLAVRPDGSVASYRLRAPPGCVRR